MKWYLKALKKYAVLNGRASRKEYWYFLLFSVIIWLILGLIDALTGNFGLRLEAGTGILEVIWEVVLIIPSWAVSVRRLHDTDHTGWWLAIGGVPIIGVIALNLVFMVKDGTPGWNQYGPDPKKAIA
ncbi:MAG TPA: DUF805 domain-containing protein [Syntrophorhabdaceae bacterium]|nr:DUF805 domain-containing protein [Syntrophorhabdaceae bacterium]